MANFVKINRRELLRLTGMGSLAAVSSTIPGISNLIAGEKDSVTVFFWDGPPLIGIREKALKPFDNVYKSCEMKFTSVPGGPAAGYNDKLFAQLAAGQAPDVFIIEIGLLPQMLKNNLLLDLKPFMDAENYDLSQFPKLAIDAYSHKGGIYGLPDNVASIAIYYNKDMFEDAGAMMPTAKWDDPGWTVDDFMNSCDRLTKTNNSGKTTQWAIDVTGWDKVWQTWVRIFGGQLVDNPFFPTECTLNDSKAVEGLQFYADLRWKHGYAPRPEAMAEMGTDALMQSGKLGMFYSGSWSFPNYRETDFTVALGHYPSGPGGRSNYVYYYPLVVPKTTKSPECAWNMLKFFNGPAMEKIIKEGGLQGTSFEEQDKWFVTDSRPPENKHVMLDAAKHFVSPDPVLTNMNKINSVMQSQIDLLLIGEEKDAKVVADEIVRKVNPLIKKGQWRA